MDTLFLGWTFTITWGWWILPVVLTLYCLWRIFRPIPHADSGIGDAIAMLFRLFWLIPVLLGWIVYLIFRLYIKV